MFSIKTLVALFVFAAPSLVRADVGPTGPAPGDRFNEGSTCKISWTGDKNSTTIWKSMAIELMSGNNTDMQFITTVTTGQDGTIDNIFDYPCPMVTVHSAIYFYQFISPLAPIPRWTGRFAIGQPGEELTPPAHSSVDDDGVAYQWGIGGLVDPTKAIAAPSFASSISTSATISSNSSTVVVVSNTPTPTPVVTSSEVADNSSPVLLSTSATPTAQTTTSGAMTAFDTRVLGAAAVATAATLVLSLVW